MGRSQSKLYLEKTVFKNVGKIKKFLDKQNLT